MGHASGEFLFRLVSIVLIDILLAGDNAVVIAMAVRSLPLAKRRMGVAVGAAGAVILRIILTFFAARILELSYVKLIGGLAILWIAVKLLTEEPGEEGEPGKVRGMGHAIRVILVADVTMSLDNILAVAASSEGDFLLLGIGLALSISFVIFTSGLLSRLMDRFPLIIWVGGAILGRVGAEMIVSDPWVIRRWTPAPLVYYGFQILLTAGVVAAGWFLKKRKGMAGRHV
ncbi:MAG: YjbE family putative metal transport protein [Terriglobia bacterium]